MTTWKIVTIYENATLNTQSVKNENKDREYSVHIIDFIGKN